MPVLPRRRDEISESVEELNGQEVYDAVRHRSRGLSRAARADPVGGFVSGQHVADSGFAAVWAITESRSSAKGGRAQYRRRCSSG